MSLIIRNILDNINNEILYSKKIIYIKQYLDQSNNNFLKKEFDEIIDNLINLVHKYHIPPHNSFNIKYDIEFNKDNKSIYKVHYYIPSINNTIYNINDNPLDVFIINIIVLSIAPDDIMILTNPTNLKLFQIFDGIQTTKLNKYNGIKKTNNNKYIFI